MLPGGWGIVEDSFRHKFINLSHIFLCFDGHKVGVSYRIGYCVEWIKREGNHKENEAHGIRM